MKKILLITVLLSILIQADELTAETCVDSTIKLEKLQYDKKITQEEFDKEVGVLCDNGCGRACTKLGGMLGSQTSKKKGCSAKFPHPWACFDLSFDEVDKEKKYKLLQKACSLGHYGSCSLLGDKFAGEKNYGKALEVFEKSCNNGLYKSCGKLGVIFIPFYTTPKNQKIV